MRTAHDEIAERIQRIVLQAKLGEMVRQVDGAGAVFLIVEKGVLKMGEGKAGIGAREGGFELGGAFE